MDKDSDAAALAAALAENASLRAQLRQLQASERIYGSILEHAPLLISTKDLQGNITSANPHFEVLAGYDEHRFVGKNVFDVFPAKIAAQLWRNDQRAAAERRPIHEEETVLHRDGSEHIYATVKFPLCHSDGSLSGTCAVSTDITATRVAEIDSMTDELTGLKNRRYLNIRFHEEVRRAQRDGHFLTLLLADVDAFKGYNDTYGHPRGDAVLVAAARAIDGTLNRPGDLVFRIGGDEFACLFTTGSEAESLALAARIGERMGQREIVHEGNPPHGRITLSLGMARIDPASGMDLAEAYELADRALYRAKHSGRNTVAC
jgi:diguanylate cyclase (GGDEF)-like protein/PAS domain S-box-containing protein